jgi:hypothetical protein
LIPRLVKTARHNQGAAAAHVRFAPIATQLLHDINPPLRATTGCEQLQQNPRLFDHLVGDGEYIGRNFEAERLSGFEVEDQLELGGLLHREISRHRAS